MKIIINKRIAKIEIDFQNSSLLKLFHVDNYDLIFLKKHIKKQHSVTLIGVAYKYFFPLNLTKLKNSDFQVNNNFFSFKLIEKLKKHFFSSYPINIYWKT